MTTGCEEFDAYVKLEAEEADRQAAGERAERFAEADMSEIEITSTPAARLAELEAECERLRAKLIRTVDGDYCGPGEIVYTPDGSYAVLPGCRGQGAPVTSIRGNTYHAGDTFSTEAARAAGGRG